MSMVPAVQEFAWTEDALPVRKAERGSSVGAEAAAKLSEEPMFCFEVGCPLRWSTRQWVILRHRLLWHSTQCQVVIVVDRLAVLPKSVSCGLLEGQHATVLPGADLT